MEKCQVDDNVSSSDQISHGLASSTGENKTSMQHQRDSDISTVSSEKVQSSQQTSIRSDVSSESEQPLNKVKKDSAERAEEVSQGDPTITASLSYHYKQLKTMSLSSKESGETLILSSVDSADPKPCQSLNDQDSAEKSHLRQHKTCGNFHQTLSDESKNVQEPESYHSQCNFDLNEDIEEDEAEYLQQSLHESNSSTHVVRVSEPIPVMAKVGVPFGIPNKPLQFGGEFGLRRSGTTSAFRPTSLRNSHREKGGCDNLKVSQGIVIDLNVAATMMDLDSDSEQPKRFLLDLNCQSENDENHHKPGSSSFDLNQNHVVENTRQTIYRQLSRNCVAVDTMRGLSHVQGQPFLVAAPAAEQARIVVPTIQSPEISFLPHHAPPGFYIGYSPTFLSHLNTGPVLAAYPRTMNLLESSQGLNPNAFANIRPTFVHGSRGPKRREPDGGWDFSQIDCRRMAPWR